MLEIIHGFLGQQRSSVHVRIYPDASMRVGSILLHYDISHLYNQRDDMGEAKVQILHEIVLKGALELCKEDAYEENYQFRCFGS